MRMSKTAKHLTPAIARALLAEERRGLKQLTASQHALFELVAHGKKPKRLNNARIVEIAPYVDAIFYSFGNKPHLDCDAECKRSGHRYQHTFEKPFPLLWDTATGRILI